MRALIVVRLVVSGLCAGVAPGGVQDAYKTRIGRIDQWLTGKTGMHASGAQCVSNAVDGIKLQRADA